MFELSGNIAVPMINQTQDNLTEHDIHLDDTIVFIHVPKAGGITLGTLIDPMWMPGSRCPEYLTLPLARLPRPQLAQYHSFAGHFNYSALAQLLPAGFKSITMLREPLSRHISFLRMLKRIGVYAADQSFLPALLQIGNPILMQIFQIANRDGGQEIMKAWREKSLEALIEDEELQKLHGMINGQTRQISPVRLIGGRIPNQPDLSETDVENVLLKTACENLGAMLGFGLMERFQDSLHMLSYLFGWRPIPDSLRLNESPEKLPTDSLPKSALSRLTRYNELDLKLYDFARALFEERYTRLGLFLLEHYGGKSHAHLKPPLPPGMMETLLEGHYRIRFLQKDPPSGKKPPSSRFTFDQMVRGGFGWQRRELSPEHGPFRWTGPGREASIDLIPLTGGDIKLHIGILSAAKRELLDGLKITVNNEPSPLHHSPALAGSMTVSTVVPAEIVSREPYLRVGLQTPETIAPHTLDPQDPDTRLLGVAVNSIEQTPGNL